MSNDPVDLSRRLYGEATSACFEELLEHSEFFGRDPKRSRKFESGESLRRLLQEKTLCRTQSVATSVRIERASKVVTHDARVAAPFASAKRRVSENLKCRALSPDRASPVYVNVTTLRYKQSMSHEASCACGQLRVEVDGDLPGSSICHCRQCQKRTGSVFGVQVKIPRERVQITGDETQFERRGEGVVTLHFCPTCGSTVYWELDGMPDVYVIAAGAFASKEVPAPVFSVYEDRMHTWVQLPDTVETHWD